MSDIPICMAMFANQAKNITCQKVNCVIPSIGTPVQILSLATGQKSDADCTPSDGRTAMAAAINTRNIHGKLILANRATYSYPAMATTVITLPTRNTVMIQPILVGSQSSRPGIGILNGRPTAVAATVIMAPARKQNITAFTMLYMSAKRSPQILRSCQ